MIILLRNIVTSPLPTDEEMVRRPDATPTQFSGPHRDDSANSLIPGVETISYRNLTCEVTCEVRSGVGVTANVSCSGAVCHFRWCDDALPWNRAANVIGKLISPVVVGLGLLGNGLSMAVMLRPKHRRTSFGVYLFALAVADNGCLASWLVRAAYMYYRRSGLDDLQCKLDIGAKYAFRSAGYGVVLLLTADRYVVVCRPLRASRWCTARVAWRASAVAFVVALVAALPNFGLQLRDPRRDYSCTMYRTPEFSVAYASLVLAGMAMCSAAILTMNCVIVVAIKRRVKYRGVCPAHRAMTGSLGAYAWRGVLRQRYDSECLSIRSGDHSSSLEENKGKKNTGRISAITTDNSDMVI